MYFPSSESLPLLIFRLAAILGGVYANMFTILAFAPSHTRNLWIEHQKLARCRENMSFWSLKKVVSAPFSALETTLGPRKSRWWQLKDFLVVSPRKLGRSFPVSLIDEHIFNTKWVDLTSLGKISSLTNGLVQPPTIIFSHISIWQDGKIGKATNLRVAQTLRDMWHEFACLHHVGVAGECSVCLFLTDWPGFLSGRFLVILGGKVAEKNRDNNTSCRRKVVIEWVS